MRKLIVLGAAALTLALGAAQAFAGPDHYTPNIYGQSWQQSQNAIDHATDRSR